MLLYADYGFASRQTVREHLQQINQALERFRSQPWYLKLTFYAGNQLSKGFLLLQIVSIRLRQDGSVLGVDHHIFKRAQIFNRSWVPILHTVVSSPVDAS